MLAGKVKLRTFLVGVSAVVLIVGCGGAGLVFASGGLLFAARADGPSEVPSAPPVVQDPVVAPLVVSEVGGYTPARPVDVDLLAFAGKALGADKIKDATAGKPYKINVYQDSTDATASRAKIDLDRDEKWDEKITFKGGEISREVAPADDELYTEMTIWQGCEWVSPGMPASSGGESALSAGSRPVDADLLAWHHKALGADKLKDVTKGKPYKINLYQDANSSEANRAKIDLDRDDKWDEKITFKGEEIEKEVAPADDENYTEVYRWSGTEWVKK